MWSVLGVHWRDWCWSWNSNTLATSCEDWLIGKKTWCWEGLGAGGEGDDRGWDGWMASLTRRTWVWVNSGSWWWTGRPGVLRFMGMQSRTRLSNWTELNWTEELLKMKAKVSQLCLTLCNPVDYTVHGILQARILEWVSCSFLQGVFLTQGSNPGLPIAGGFLTSWATREGQEYWSE